MHIATSKIVAYSTSAALVALLIARQIGEAQISNDYYQLIEWRIFYPGHFIRRGLRGTLVDWLSHVTTLPPDTLIRWSCTLAYAVLSVLFTVYIFRWLWDRSRSCIPILLLSPAGFFFYQNAVLSVERMDVFFLLLTVCHLELCVRSKDEKTYVALSTVIFATLGVAGVLSHEAFLLLCMPVNIMLSSWRLGRWDGRLFMIYAAPAAAACFCIFSHVSVMDIAILSRDLGVPVGSFEWYNGPIFLLAIPVTRQMEVVRAIFTADAVRPFLGTAILFGAIHFAVLQRPVSASKSADSAKGWTHPERLWRDLLWIPFLCTVPMYVVAADYGRWFAMVVATFTICCARLLQVTKPVKRSSTFWNLAAIVVFIFVPMPLSLRFPNSSPQLLSWTGAAILGRFFGPPRRPNLEGNPTGATRALRERKGTLSNAPGQKRDADLPRQPNRRIV